MKYGIKAFCWLLFFFLSIYLGMSTISLRLIAQNALDQERDQALAAHKSAALLFAAMIEDTEPTTEQWQQLGNTVQHTANNPFEIIDQEGQQLYHSDPLYSGLATHLNQEDLVKNTIQVSEIIELNEQKSLLLQSQIGGSPYIFISTQQLVRYPETLKQGTDFFRILLLVLQLILIPISLFLTNLITKPIRQLIEQATNIANGQTTKPFKVKRRGDEVDDLAISLNQMAKKMNQDLRQIRKEKEKQELFVSSLTHEIATPLTSIIGYAQMLQWEELSDSSTECVDYILSESFRLKQMSEDILRLLHSQKHELQCTAIAASQLETYLAAFIGGLDQAIALDLDLQQATVYMDLNLFKVVAANIVANAVEAMATPKELSITGRIDNGRYFITFKDNGRGIPADQIEKVTDAFFTSDLTRNEGHLGIGLSLVQNIVSLHDGEVTIISKKGAGTSMTIDFALNEVNV